MSGNGKTLKVGFVGLGEIGAPMAQRIMQASWPLTIYARRPQALEPFRNTPAIAVPTLRALGERSDMVCVSVFDDAQIEAVVLGEAAGDGLLAGMRNGSVIVIHSTAQRDTCRRVAAAAAGHGSAVLDAPVSGGPDGAKAGTLAVMVGGDAAPFERCRPVLESFSRPVRHVGPLGSRQSAKTISNALYAAQGQLVDEAVSLGASLGLDRRALIDMLQAGSADSFVLRRYANTASLDYWVKQRGTATGSVVDVLSKDARLYHDLAASAGHAAGDVGRLAEAFASALRERDGKA
ncbi:MAG: NAD(P)-dependent oxidoreductase [Betaproteobacteria bacterium]|nr:NAD(P)-dependent oxidoreductase [Betaproteobacteria bacterium]